MIVLLLTSQNEAAALRLNLEHHLNYGIDKIAVADNASTDETQDVIAEFGPDVSCTIFDDFHQRQLVRMAMLNDIRARHAVEWVGVCDTDEFFFAHGDMPRDVLREVPPNIVAANFIGQLFLPTALDAAHGSFLTQRRYRTTLQTSRLHTSYKEGKTFYRSDWLTAIDHEHLCLTVPHDIHRHPVGAFHHYMVRDEDQFVNKVSRLIAWSKEPPPAKKLLRRAAAPQLPKWSSWFKKEWWQTYVDGGEAAVRDYYRTRYTLSEHDVARHTEAGELTFDESLAKHWESTHSA